MTPADFLALVGPMAREAHAAHGVPASVTLAQAILESGWGESELATKASALFGIKYGAKWSEATSPYVRGAYAKASREYLSGQWVTVTSDFCRYDSWADSILDHGLFLRRPVYAGAFTTTTADDFARAIHRAGYATDPAYSARLIELMRAHDLYRYDRQETAMTITLIIAASKQDANQYAGGAGGPADSEWAHMQSLADQLGARIPGSHVIPGTDVTGDGRLSYADNVSAVNALSDRLVASGTPRASQVFLSVHSNAMGDAMALATSAAGKALRARLVDELNAANIMPYGDVWTVYDRDVAELVSTKPAAVLLEVGQHDREDYAAWLREHIADGSLADWLAARIRAVLDMPAPPAPVVATDPLVVSAPATLVEDGILGPRTVKALQRWVGARVDGIWGRETTRALQRYLNGYAV